jgi:Glyoxalase/Bleomycin resistance protein/Dioxygenase superfamily
MCDDLDATVAELRAKGIEFGGEPENQGFGTVMTMVLPGGVDMTLYQPRHATAI